MDFRKLSFFEAVCRLHSFTKASSELHVSQPSVTIAIQNLEEELEVPLLNRYPGGFSLTPEGEFLYEKSQMLIKELENTKLALQESAAGRPLMLRIGYSVQMRDAISPVLAHFQESRKNIRIIENESATPSIVKQLEEGALDFGVVVATKYTCRNMKVYPLFQGDIRVCMSKKNPVSSCEAITLEQFERLPLIALSLDEPRNSYIFKVFQEAYPDRAINLKPLFSSLQLNSYFQRIQNNDGVGLTYHDKWFHMSQYDTSPGEGSECIELPFIPRCIYTVALIFRKEKTLNKIQNDFLKYITSSL